MTLKKSIRYKLAKQNHFKWNGVEVIVKDQIVNPDISVKDVLKNIEVKIPANFLSNVDVIYIGEFEFFKERQIQAMYENSCIFVTNQQEDIQDMADDIVHEIAHSLEEQYQSLIYFDGRLEDEFLEKRKKLYFALKGEGLEADLQHFMNTSYDQQFDEYLYKQVGYSLLAMISSNVFYSPYAATSLREYFANGFEAFFYFSEYEFIKNNCPQLFIKMNKLMEALQ